jgi:membrane protein
MKRSELPIFLRFVAMRFNEDRCLQIASSLTITTLLSLVPLITIALTVFSAFPVFSDYSTEITNYLSGNLMPESAGRVITHYTEQFANSAGKMGVLGLIFLGVTAMTMMVTIDHAFNTIWRATRLRPPVKSVIVYWALLTLAPVLIGASLSLTSWLVGFSIDHAGKIPNFITELLKSLPMLFTALSFAILFRTMPNRYVPIPHALIGSVVASILFETMNRVFGFYVSHFPTYDLVYGTFASVPIFLMWIYLSWLTILLGAVVTASLPHWRTQELPYRPAGVQMLDALRVLKLMSRGMQEGRVLTIPALSEELHLGFYTLEQLMKHLVTAKLVCKAEGQGWLLVRDVAHIHARDLFHLFVLDEEILQAEAGDEPLKQWFAACTSQMACNTNISLQELFTTPISQAALPVCIADPADQHEETPPDNEIAIPV